MPETDLPATLNALFDRHFPAWLRALDLRVTEAEPGRLALRLPLRPDICRPDGSVTGQALMAFADTGMVLALAAESGRLVPAATLTLTTTFLTAIRGEAAVMEVALTRRGRAVSFLTAEIRAEGRPEPGAQVQAVFAMPREG